MLESNTVPDLSSLTELDKASLKKVSAQLKNSGAAELASLLDVTISHITLAEIEAGDMRIYGEDEFEKRYARYE